MFLDVFGSFVFKHVLPFCRFLFARCDSFVKLKTGEKMFFEKTCTPRPPHHFKKTYLDTDQPSTRSNHWNNGHRVVTCLSHHMAGEHLISSSRGKSWNFFMFFKGARTQDETCCPRYRPIHIHCSKRLTHFKHCNTNTWLLFEAHIIFYTHKFSLSSHNGKAYAQLFKWMYIEFSCFGNWWWYYRLVMQRYMQFLEVYEMPIAVDCGLCRPRPLALVFHHYQPYQS